MATSTPDIILVSGAWHQPESYAKFRIALEAQGLTVHIPRLTTMNGERPPTTDLYTDSAAIRKFVTGLADAGRSLVVLMHSYGGQVGTEAIAGLGAETRQQQGLSGGVVKLVYIAGVANEEGQTMMDLPERFGRAHFIPIMMDFADDGTVVHRYPGERLVGPGLSDEELEEYVASLERWNGAGLRQPLNQCAWRDIPVSYVHTTKNDVGVPLDNQEIMVESMRAAGCEVQTFALETGHCPNITKTEELVSIIGQIIEGIVS